MQNDWPIVRDLVLVGGGHAHALVLRRWGMDPQPGVRVTLINPGPVAPYTGMLPGHVAGHYTRAELMIDLQRLCQFAGARFLSDRAVGIDRASKRILLTDRTVRYDIASLDIGITSDLPDLPGFAEHAVAAKPLDTFAARWQAFVADAPPAPRIVVIGAGIGGVELALAAAHRLGGMGRKPAVTLLERSPDALPHIGKGARAALLSQLARAGITVEPGSEPAHIGPSSVTLGDGRALASDFTLSVAGARSQGWLEKTGLTLDGGFVTVSPALQSSDPAIFAVGDCAYIAHAPRPKAGVYAVRAAPVLHQNLRAALIGRPLRAYNPQSDYLKLVSTGGKSAVADKAGLRLEGRALWWLKDRIDRAFMAKFSDYPAMRHASVPLDGADGLAEALGDRPACGGCGAKLGAETLASALAALPPPRREDVLSGPGDDAAVLRAGTGLSVITTDHLRAVTADPALMARIAAMHALGDVLAMGAAPQAALAQVILPRSSPAIAADMLAEIMATAAEVFGAEGADVVGGHSSAGAELTIGFTVTGLLASVADLRRKGGALAGDALILTKPLGSGTILAALMANATAPGVILGEAVVAAFAMMTAPPGPAARILAPEAHAMTDVTGFGLAGHLLELCEASGTGARLNLAALPFLPGAVALASAGQASTLAPANRAALAGRITALEGPEAALLYDPQTCGGFLAAVAPDRVAALLAALGPGAAHIGDVTEGPAHLTVTA